MAVRAVRGATQVTRDDREHVLAVTRELVEQVMTKNDLVPEDVISVLFTATSDISSVAPALAARQLGMNEVALICVQEMDVDQMMPRLIRLMAHVETERTPGEIENIYLRGTNQLRAEVPPIAAG